MSCSELSDHSSPNLQSRGTSPSQSAGMANSMTEIASGEFIGSTKTAAWKPEVSDYSCHATSALRTPCWPCEHRTSQRVFSSPLTETQFQKRRDFSEDLNTLFTETLHRGFTATGSGGDRESLTEQEFELDQETIARYFTNSHLWRPRSKYLLQYLQKAQFRSLRTGTDIELWPKNAWFEGSSWDAGTFKVLYEHHLLNASELCTVLLASSSDNTSVGSSSRAPQRQVDGRTECESQTGVSQPCDRQVMYISSGPLAGTGLN